MSDSSNLPLDDADHCRVWLLSFEAHCRSKHLQDRVDPHSQTSPMTDKFLERCGTRSLLKIVSLLPGKDVASLLFSDIKKALMSYLEPTKRLLIADRTNFLQLSQSPGESVVEFVARLNEAASLSKWELLEKETASAELVKLRFLAGLQDSELKLRLLERLQVHPTYSITDLVDFCLTSNQIKSFVASGDGLMKAENFHVSSSSSKRPNPKDKSGDFFKSCKFCGRSHVRGQCPADGKACNKCAKKGHFASMCPNTPKGKTSNDPPSKGVMQSSTNNVNIFTMSLSANGLMQEVSIMGQTLSFQLDTGAARSIMSEKQWQTLGSPPLRPTLLQPTNFDGSLIKTLGELHVPVVMQESKRNLVFLVVKATRSHGLLGRDVIDTLKSSIATFAIDDSELPTIRNFKASISLIDPNKKLKFGKARPIPVHLRDTLDCELDRLVKQGVISPIDHATHASPVVWVKKANGQYRMCVDFKATLNCNIQADAYPLPTSEEIFARVGNASKFAKIDLKSAYWQIALDDEA